MKSRSVTAVLKEMEDLRKVLETMKAGQPPTATAGSGQQAAGSKEPEKPPAPAAAKPA